MALELETVLARLEHERGGPHGRDEVLLLTPDGGRYELLSLNWDDEHGHWVLIGERSE